MREIVITNRRLCEGDFLYTIEKALYYKPWAVILREKDLTKDDYVALAKKVRPLCESHGVTLYSHTHAVPELPLYLPFQSVHCVEEARAAQDMQADFIIAGHIFATQCKPGLAPRGLDFLREVCESVRIPVFAIGGITHENAQCCIDAGAAGLCRMSYWMQSS